jgi:hypothetical protein
MSQNLQFVPSLETLHSKCLPSALGSLPGGLATTLGQLGAAVGSLGPVVSQFPSTVGQKELLVQLRAAWHVCVPFAKRGRVVIDFGAHHLT